MKLHDNQMGIFLECVNEENSVKYNMLLEYVFDSSFDIEKLKSSLEKVISVYSSFSLGIVIDNGSPEFVRSKDGTPKVAFAKTTEKEYQEKRNGFLRPFAFDGSNLCRFSIFETEKSIYLLTEVHHIIYDGISATVFERALENAYCGQELPPEDVLEENENDKNLEESYSFFERQLDGIEEISNLLPDRQGVDYESKNNSRESDVLSLPMNIDFKRLSEFARSLGVSENIVLLSAFSYALAKYTCQENSVFTSIHSGRYGKKLGNAINFYVRTFPLCFSIDEKVSVTDFIQNVKEIYKSSMVHSDASFIELSERFGIRSDIKFIYQGELLGDFTFCGKKIEKNILGWDEAHSNMELMITKSGDELNMKVNYLSSLYTKENVLQFLDLFSVIAGEMLEKKFLGEIEFVDEKSRKILDRMNSTEADYDDTQTVWSLVENRIRENPEKTAVVFKDKVLTYSRLDELSKKLSAYIAEKNIGKNQFVAVLIERSEMMAVTAIGIARSGAAMLPLDSTYPEERLNYMVKDSGASLLVCDRKLRGLLNDYHGDVLFTDEIASLSDGGKNGSLETSNALAIIYTSGTTGNPKGCILEHRNIVCFFHSHVKNMGISNESRIATYASFGFDAGLMDVYTTLMAGASLYVIPEEIRLDVAQMNEFYKENSITHGFMTTQVARMFAQTTDCKTLETMLAGGEKLVPFDVSKNFRFINGYGPSETFAYVCSHQVKDQASLQPIGKPNENTKLYVTDKFGRLLPQGSCGELLISGRQVGRGYLNQSEKTAESFIKNNFCTQKNYERCYKTGDIVRLLGSGEIDFIGRRDGQVKIRGFRVELTEVEKIIGEFETVKNVTVQAFDNPGGGKYLAAFVVCDGKMDSNALSNFIVKTKPAYMVPQVFVQVENIPLNANGKVDRKKLPAPVCPESSVKNFEAENELQEKISEILNSILGHKNFSKDSDLFACGLSSIGTLKLNIELAKEFNRNFKVSEINENATVEKLEKLILGKEESKKYEKRSEYPLMQNQHGVYVECSMNGSTDYNIPMLFKIGDNVDKEKLRNAIEKAINIHPFIKAFIKSDSEGNLFLERNDECDPQVNIYEIKKLPDTRTLVEPFKLEGGNLYRAKIFCTEEGNYLFMDFHHIISDGTSVAILIEDINSFYEGKAVSVEEFSGYDASLEEEELRKSERYDSAMKYFENLLSGINTDCLPAGGSIHDGEHGSTTLTVQGKKIKEFCKANNFSLNAFFNAVFCYVLSEFIHSDNVTYCTVHNGRTDSRLERTFAMLVKTVPVTSWIDGNKKILTFIENVQKQLIETMANEAVGFPEISRNFGVKPEIFFNYQGDFFEFNSIAGSGCQQIELKYKASKAPFAIQVFERNGNFVAQMDTSLDKFCKEFDESFLSSLFTAAENFTECNLLSQVSILSENEKKILGKMNETRLDVPYESTASIISKKSRENPDAVVVKTRNSSITFRQLDEYSTNLACNLKKLGVKNNDIVAMVLERSEFVVVAEIGINKAGAAFLPMLPSYPKDRIEYCIKDAGCKFVLRDRKPSDKAGNESVSYDYAENLFVQDLIRCDKKDEISLPYIDENMLAYCIYTSGSTGNPKGVMIEQKNFSNYNQLNTAHPSMEKAGTFLCLASISFDMSLSEIFLPLVIGKTIYIASEEEIHNLDLLNDAMIKNRIEFMIATPTFTVSLLTIPEFEKAFSNIKAIMLGAESFQNVLFDKLKSLNPQIEIINGYGPTEATQASSFKLITDPSKITIGKPLPNVKYYVLDNYGNFLPRYAAGELIICGRNVGRGYINLPEKTSQSFFEIEGERAYRSGDLVRINRDNEVEFFGRKDNQVKLRGFRIELDEVEKVMLEFKDMLQASVIVKNNGTEDYLAGFFTASKKIETEKLISHLKTKLNYYMIPQVFIQLEKMPVTPNGKLDKKALKKISADADREETSREKTPPETAKKTQASGGLCAAICEAFRSVLNVKSCGEDENFFEIGGTSLSAAKVVMILKSKGITVDYQDIFDCQTARKIAERVGKANENFDANAEEKASDKQEQDAVNSQKFNFKTIASKYDDVLKYNSIKYFSQAERKPLGNVVLTGATGFLGAHVLKDLIENEAGKIYCITRKGKSDTVENRIRETMFYYFEEDLAGLGSKVSVIEGDITDDNLLSLFENIQFDTLINCAACVKHYAKDGSIEFVNVHGVENLINLCKKKNAKLIQISTTSIPGAHNEQTYQVNLKMAEDRLFVIDDMNNQYIESKFKAETLVLDAVMEGMKGKIIRVGNLMGRYSDGEFQTNLRTNSFLNGLRGFAAIGKCQASHSTDPMILSPIDCTARAVVLLAGTNDIFTVFNAESRAVFDEAKLMEAMNRCNIPVVPVTDEEYNKSFLEVMSDPEKNEKVSTLSIYEKPDMHMVKCDTRFTATVLYGLGFSWPFNDDRYLEKVIIALQGLSFFDM